MMTRQLLPSVFGAFALVLGLSSGAVQAAEKKCQTHECFVKQASLCKPAIFDTQTVAGGQARYKVYGPNKKAGECNIDFKFLQNPDQSLVGSYFYFVIQTEQDLDSQLKEGVAECLEGKSGTYRCSGALWQLIVDGKKPELRMASAPPCGVAIADEGPSLYAMPKNGKWGYVTRDGQWAIEPQWHKAAPFSEGRAAVFGDGGWGIIDRDGQYVLEPSLETIRPFSEGCAAASNVEPNRDPFRKYFFVARDGSLWQYDAVPEGTTLSGFQGYGDFSQGKAWFYMADFSPEEQEYGWIDTNGDVVIPRLYSGAGNFVDGLVPAAQGGDYWALMDENGNASVPDRWRFDEMGPMSEGLVAIRIDVFTSYYMSAERIAITKIDLKYPDRPRKGVAGEHNIIKKAGAFHDGLAAVQPKWGYLGDEQLMFIRPDGAEAFAPERDLKLLICDLDPLPEYQDGLVRLKVSNGDCEDGYQVYLNTSGKIVLEEPRRDSDVDAIP